jgi:putative flippase GtrA
MSTDPKASGIAPTVTKVTLKSRLLQVWHSWATRSLMVGAGATVLDIALGSTLLFLGATARISAMVGVVLGAAFTFFANRHFAFKERSGEFARPALRFLLATALASVAHGQVVHMLRDNAGIPFVVAKMMADVAVFTFGQMLLLRYVVFPKTKHVPEPKLVDAR